MSDIDEYINVSRFLNASAHIQELAYISLGNVLSTPICSGTSNIQDNFLECNHLSAHMRCTALTLNLVATKDVAAPLITNIFKGPFRAAMAKTLAIWNRQSRSKMASDSISSELGRKLVLPNLKCNNKLQTIS